MTALRHGHLAGGVVAEGDLAGERRARLLVDVVRTARARDLRRRGREALLDSLLDLPRVDLLGAAAAPGRDGRYE